METLGRGRPETESGPSLLDRLERCARRSDRTVRGRNPYLLVVSVLAQFVKVRVTGLAAEMTYFLLLSLVPLLTALGASLGLLERVIGSERVSDVESAILQGMESVLSEELTEEVMAPLVQELLTQQRSGLALGSLLLALVLGGRVFRAAIRALDDAYQVRERRNLVQQWVLSVAFTFGAVLTTALGLAAFVVGPLLGGEAVFTDRVGFEGVWSNLWRLGRWPVMFLVGTLFLAWVYRVGPNVDNTWRETLPGAVSAVAGISVLLLGFRYYVTTIGSQQLGVGGTEAVVFVAQFIASMLAVLLLGWLVSTLVLLGGVLNKELNHPDEVPGEASGGA